MIKFSNGHNFKYMVASGALAFDGRGWPWEWPWRWIGCLDPSLFTVVIKTLTFHRREGNPGCVVRILRDGTVNAVGLRNPGIDWWCKEIGPKVNSKKIPLVGSIFGELDELAEMARMLNDFDLVGLEINASCPNTETDILCNTSKVIKSCEVVKENSRFPLILKLSFVHGNSVNEIVKGVGGIIEAFSINSVPWKVIFPNRRSPLEKYGGGGVSGKIAQPFTWNLVWKLSQKSQIPVIGPGIWDFDDMERVKRLGAKAVSFGSVFFLHPWRPTMFVRRAEK